MRVDIILTSILSAFVVSIINYLLIRGKTTAETQKILAETQKILAKTQSPEIELDLKKQTIEKMKAEVEQVKLDNEQTLLEAKKLRKELGDEDTDLAQGKEVIKIIDKIELNIGKLLTLIEKSYKYTWRF